MKPSERIQESKMKKNCNRSDRAKTTSTKEVKMIKGEKQQTKEMNTEEMESEERRNKREEMKRDN